jgi:hypothetical protein
MSDIEQEIPQWVDGQTFLRTISIDESDSKPIGELSMRFPLMLIVFHLAILGAWQSIWAGEPTDQVADKDQNNIIAAQKEFDYAASTASCRTRRSRAIAPCCM